MYKAKTSKIIEDLFGIDHLFLKGHEYIINVDDTEREIRVGGANYARFMPKQGFFLSSEVVKEHFEIVKYGCVIVGKGNPNLLSFEN